MGDTKTSYQQVKAGNHFALIIDNSLLILSYRYTMTNQHGEDRTFMLSNRFYNFSSMYDKIVALKKELPKLANAPIILYEESFQYSIITDKADQDEMFIRLKLIHG